MSNTSQKSTDLTAKPLTTMSGHEGYIWTIAYLPGGQRVVTFSPDKTIRTWDAEKGEQEGASMVQEGWLHGIAVTRDGNMILGGGKDKRIRVWDVETREPVEEWASHTSFIWCISLSPDDQLAAIGDDDGKIVIREMKESGGIKHSINAGSKVHSLCFSPNGEKLACGVAIGTDGVHIIQIYDVESGEVVLGPIKGHGGWIWCVLWSLDGNQLFSSSADHAIMCWDPETGESIGEPWIGHTDTVYSLSLSPDGTKVASGSGDNTIRFWDSRSGDPIEQPLQHEDRVYAVTFSPSGEFVASGGSDRKLSIWRVPWWEDSQKQTHRSLLDLPAVPVPKDQHRGEFDFLDLPTRRRPIISSSLPPVPANLTTVPITARVQRFWHGLTTRRSPSSPPQQTIELQPVQGRRFWKSAVRIPVTEVAAGRLSDRVKVGRSVPKKKKKKQVDKSKKKDDKSREPQKAQTEAGSSGTKAGPSTSHAGPSASNAGPSNSQTGPSNAAPVGRSSSFAQSNTGSDDSWDDMYCCDKCVDYGCFGPRENRERFRPWKKKSRATMEAEKQAKEAKTAKKRKHHRKHRTTKAADPPNVVDSPHRSSAEAGPSASKSTAGPSAHDAGSSTSSNVPGEEPRSSSAQFNSDSFQGQKHTKKGKGREIDLGRPTNQVTDSQSAVHVLHHHDQQGDHIKAGSSTFPAADEVDVQHAMLQLQEQVEQLRQRLDDSQRKAETERYLLEKEVKELRSQVSESHKQPGPRLSIGSPTMEAGPSSSQAQPSV